MSGMTPHRLLGAVGASALALVVAAIAYWFVAAQALREGLDRWAEARRAEGYEIRYGTPAIGGFPIRLRLIVADPSITTPADKSDAGWNWRGTSLQVETRLWNMRSVTFSLPGRHEFTRPGLTHPIVARADPAVGWVAIGHDGRITEANLDCVKLEVDLGERPGRVTAGHTVLSVRPRPRQADPHEPLPPLEATIALRDLLLPPNFDGPLGRHVPLASTDISVNYKLPAGASRGELARWRDDGGTFEVLDIKLRWGPLNLKGSGTVTIDEAMRPLGAATVEIRGFNETLDELIKAGVVQKQLGLLAQAMLNVLAKPAKGGGPPVLSVPLTVQDGFLSLGPARLLPVPPLALN